MNLVQTISIKENNPSSSQTIPSEVQTIISQPPKEGTDSSLCKAIKDLKVQRQELDTTINVLPNYLDRLSTQVESNSKKKRSKPDGI